MYVRCIYVYMYVCMCISSDTMATIGEDDEPPGPLRVSANTGPGGDDADDKFIEAEEVDFDSVRGSM